MCPSGLVSAIAIACFSSGFGRMFHATPCCRERGSLTKPEAIALTKPEGSRERGSLTKPGLVSAVRISFWFSQRYGVH
jgi:hypothetical protein